MAMGTASRTASTSLHLGLVVGDIETEVANLRKISSRMEGNTRAKVLASIKLLEVVIVTIHDQLDAIELESVEVDGWAEKDV